MSATEVCETVTADTTAGLRAARDRVSHADLVELRLDTVRDLDVAGALEGRRKPVVVTCRPAWEGGHFRGAEEDRLRVLTEASQLGADYLDVEWRADRRTLRLGDRTRVVLSHHVFDGVPADLVERVHAMRAERPAVVKVAITASRLRDCLTLRRAAAGGGGTVAIAMGPSGLVTRVWPAFFGSVWTYAGSAAPGQLPARDLVEMYRVRHTTADTAPYAVLGAPLGHSASPAMHNAAFADLGLDAVYAPLESHDADDALAFAQAVGLRGASVTAPLKEALAARADAGDDLVRLTGAANTLRWGASGIEARNFDVAAFLAPLERRSMRLRGVRGVVLGSGGAARAAAFALKAHGARVEIAARRREAADRLAAELRVQAADWPPEPGWDILVNATPVGTWPDTDAAPIDRDHVRGGLVYDLVYNPPRTRLLEWARSAGADVIGGLDMLVGQARRQFHWWTGHDASAATLERAALEFLNRSTRQQS